jgi:type IV secretory pathway component VirB8
MQTLSGSVNSNHHAKLSYSSTESQSKIRGQNEYSFKSLMFSRVFMLVATFMMAFTTFLSLSLLQVIPAMQVDTALIINGNQSTDLVSIEPYHSKMVSKQDIMELFVRKYVEARHSITSDTLEQDRYWSPGGVVWFLSTPSIYRKFYKGIKPYLKVVKRGAMTREVEIIGVQRQGKTALWSVDFKIHDVDTQSLIVTEKYKTANLTCRFMKSNIRYTRRMINPLGFIVSEYNYTDIDVENKTNK